jgi:4-amino-4-deoxy-L-arabinose transferase-like glycosyltransferase
VTTVSSAVDRLRLQIAGRKRQRLEVASFSTVRLYVLGLVVLTLLGFSLRLYLLDSFPFREDEAIYSFWALHFWRIDPFFLTVWPDKPPLFIWLLGGIFQLLGPNQVAARWLNIALSTLTIPVLGATAYNLWNRRAALVAATLFSLSPFAISFAPTAYTDPMLVLAGSLALYMAITSRAFWAGIWLGIAIMTKQQGVLYMPLVLGLLLQSQRQSVLYRPASPLLPGHYALRTTHSLRHIFPITFLAGLTLIILPILYWDSLRWAVAPSPWDLGVRNYGALAFVPLIQWLPNLRDWLNLAWYLTASWWVWLALILAALLIPFFYFRRYPSLLSLASLQYWRQRRFPSPALLLCTWSIAFLALHIVTNIQIWDRYLLPLAPMLALLCGWWAIRWSSHLPGQWLAIGLAIIGLGMVPAAWNAAAGKLPIGGDHGGYTGLTDALNQIEQMFPDQVTLYHQTLGWHYQFYLFDQIARADYELRWFTNAVYLADNAVKAPHQHRILIEPLWRPIPHLTSQLRIRGLTLQTVGRFGQFIVYLIDEPPQPFCDWCLCKLPIRWPLVDMGTGSQLRGSSCRP